MSMPYILDGAWDKMEYIDFYDFFYDIIICIFVEYQVYIDVH